MQGQRKTHKEGALSRPELVSNRQDMLAIPNWVAIVDHHSQREKKVDTKFENFEIWTCHCSLLQ